MSQDDNNIAISAVKIRKAIQGLVDREKGFLTNLDTVASSIMTAADYLSILKDREQVEAYKELVLNLGRLAHEVRTNQSVLQHLGETYTPSLEKTDFEALLDQQLKDRLQQQPYRPQGDARFREFQEVIAAAGINDPGGGDGGGGGDDDDDDDLGDNDFREEDTGRSWINDKCPLSMKEVFDLQRPVKDSLGYVYEESYIRDYLRGRRNGLKHPCAGVNQEIRETDLKPADDVLRAKRRKRLMEALGGPQAGGGTSQGGPDVFDV